MSDFLSKIKSFLVKSEKRPFNQFCSDYLKIKGELVVSDAKVSGRELNFKVSWRGSVVPFWVLSTDDISQEKVDSKVQNALCVIAAGLSFGLNLVEISQELKNYPVLV